MEDFISNMDFGDVAFQEYVRGDDGIAYPRSMDMRDLVLETEDQGRTSQCAAYTATSWIESVMWRRTGRPVHYDPQKLYDFARSQGNAPADGGLTMTSIMNAMVDLNMCPGCTRADIRYVTGADELKRAIHRYGTCLTGFAITDRWMGHVGRLVFDQLGGRMMGGHAMICTGYNDVGVFLQNSWGVRWGKYGFACVTWDVFNSQFRVGAYLRNCLNDVEA